MPGKRAPTFLQVLERRPATDSSNKGSARVAGKGHLKAFGKGRVDEATGFLLSSGDVRERKLRRVFGLPVVCTLDSGFASTCCPPRLLGQRKLSSHVSPGQSPEVGTESGFHNQSGNTEEKLGQRSNACLAAAACKAARQLWNDTGISVSDAGPLSPPVSVLLLSLRRQAAGFAKGPLLLRVKIYIRKSEHLEKVQVQTELQVSAWTQQIGRVRPPNPSIVVVDVEHQMRLAAISNRRVSHKMRELWASWRVPGEKSTNHTLLTKSDEPPPKKWASFQRQRTAESSSDLESQNRIGWKRPLRSSSPTVNLTPPRPPLHHVPKHLIQTSFKYLQGWRLNHFPGQPVPMLDNPFSEVTFPNIQSKPPLAQLEAISSCPLPCYLGEETDPHLSTASFQVAVESDKVSPQPPFLQAKQPQLPQPLLISLVLQTLPQLRCPSLDTLQPLNVSLVGPKLNTAFEVRPPQCRVQGDNHFPSPAGHTIFDTSQDAIGFLGRLCTLLAHIQAAVNQHPQVLLCLAAFQPLFPKPVALHGVAVAQVQDLALGLVKPHTVDLGPSIQPVQVPLQSLPTLKQINTPAQLGVICKLTEGALDPLIQIIDKDVKQNWPQHRALGNRPPTGVNSIHHHSLGPAVQPVLYPARRTPKFL
ncbi:LOW QUALITY PROTEIN: hypothetical protein QYF61_026657 [Mycteria americana]|uniref:Uncharacterized protein n=1 Tax=Mycteria americana TaxID=33587 RepID=A0AAN7PLT4_MYCAM|nr:LOW QUALITY PROTEIN: hypothetical protein QYF61_026657 [Mycteria americana]